MFKKSRRLIFFLFLTLISTKSLLHRGVPVTHDGNSHLVRFANYYVAFKEFQWPPRLAPNLINHYGYPAFNFNYPLANILSLPLSLLGFNYEFSFKIITIVFVFLGIMGAHLWLREKKFSSRASYFAVSLFALTPYLLSTIVFRGNIGELISWGILPWIFYFLEKIKNDRERPLVHSFFGLTLFLILMFLSHNITAFFASGLIIFYLFFLFKKDLSKWLQFGLSFILAFTSSLWFWLPAMLEKKLTILEDVDLTINYYKHFPSLKQLLALPIDFGYSYWGRVDGMSFGLGLVQIVISFLALIFFVKCFKNKKTQQNLVFFFLLALLFVFQLPVTKVVYDQIPLAQFIQFPWRLALLFSLMLLPASALIYENLNRSSRQVITVLLIIQFFQFCLIVPVDYNSKNKIDYIFYPGSTSTNKENMPKTFTYQGFADWQPTATILDGQGSVEVESWRGSRRTYQLDLSQKSTIIEPTAYFAGWETKVRAGENQAWQKINYIDNEVIQGRLAYQLEAGRYQVKSRFTQKTWPRILGNSISVASLGLLSFSYLSFLKKGKNKNLQ